MTNLEKSISTYHDKLEAIEGANIEYRTKLSTSEETIERLNNEIAARNNKINQLEDVMRQSKQDVNHTNSFRLGFVRKNFRCILVKKFTIVIQYAIQFGYIDFGYIWPRKMKWHNVTKLQNDRKSFKN